MHDPTFSSFFSSLALSWKAFTLVEWVAELLYLVFLLPWPQNLSIEHLGATARDSE